MTLLVPALGPWPEKHNLIQSKSTEGVGFAAVFPNTTSGGRLTREASIFTAELYAINAAVHEIVKGTIDGSRFTIFSD